MPFLVSATGPEMLSQEEIERRRDERLARKKKERKPALATKPKKKKNQKERSGLTDPIRACEACQTQASTGMPSLISQDWLCMRCIQLEQAEQIRLDAEEKLWF